MSRRSFKKSLGFTENIYGLFFILPALALIGLFQLYPIISGVVYSFFTWNGFEDKVFVGLKNFTRIPNDVDFMVSVKNTIYYVLGSVPISIVVSLIIANLLNLKIKGAAFFKSIYFLPNVSSVVAISVVWRWVFGANYGLINVILYSMGLPTPNWLGDTSFVIPSFIIMSIWSSIGTNIIILLSALQGVPETLYEAATIDRADSFQKFRHITVPLISPTIFFLLIISIINSFQVFSSSLVMTQGGPGNASLFIVLDIYRQAFQNFNMGYASALANVLFASLLLLTIIQWIGRKYWVYNEV